MSTLPDFDDRTPITSDSPRERSIWPIKGYNDIILAIDPGVEGGWAVAYPQIVKGGSTGWWGLVRSVSWSNRYSFISFVKELQRYYQTSGEPRPQYAPQIRTYIEKVASSPQMGVVSSFTFGQNYGEILSTIESLLPIPPRHIFPAKWQKGIPDLPTDYHPRKRKLMQLAQKLFPTEEVNYATSDALCLLDYAMRMEYINMARYPTDYTKPE